MTTVGNKLIKGFFILLFLFILNGCKKENPQLDPPLPPVENEVKDYQITYLHDNKEVYKYTYKQNTPITNPKVFKNGYHHIGWTLDGKTLINLSSFLVKSDIKLYPLFEKKELVVKFYDYHGKTTVVKLLYGDKLVYPQSIKKDGYKIKELVDINENKTIQPDSVFTNLNLQVIYEPLDKTNVVDIKIEYSDFSKTYQIIKGDTFPSLPNYLVNSHFEYYENKQTLRKYEVNSNNKIDTNLDLRAIYQSSHYTLRFYRYYGDWYPCHIRRAKGNAPLMEPFFSDWPQIDADFIVSGWVARDGEIYDINKEYDHNIDFYLLYKTKDSQLKYFEYSENNNQITITKYTNTEEISRITIPSKINNKPVVALAARAFENSKIINEVVLPNSITSIGDYCFYRSKLRYINFPENLTYLGDAAFMESGLVKAVINKNLTKINKWAFKNTDLSMLSLPTSLEEIGMASFANISALYSVIFPSSLKKINSFAFAYCTHLVRAKFNEGLLEIGDWAFLKTDLFYVQIPESVIKYGEYVFAESSLREISIYLNFHLQKDTFSFTEKLEMIYILKNNPKLPPNWNYDSKYSKYHNYKIVNK